MSRSGPSPSFEASPPVSRPRFWATRLLLFVACVSVVATSEPVSENVLSEEYVGAPLSISTEAPKAVRRLIVRASAPKPPSKEVEAEMTARVTARWRPTDPSQTASPWLRVSLVDTSNDYAIGSKLGVLTEAEPVTVEVEPSTNLSTYCELDEGCEWSVDLTLEVQPNAAPGTVELEWTTQARARVVGTSSTPKGFTVTVSEP
ncbi:hypothetical protein [Corallococcus silvisoli]|uniref:hypothetical protein n=1 Tax=Corallococcus silvisoli TaxID=2697031 RepID=UPI0013783F5B|nr:hypothetical protein [Corallococcus silvisoli]NBD12321.1 hypothetical protein [Corallococcus silvisoli]